MKYLVRIHTGGDRAGAYPQVCLSLELELLLASFHCLCGSMSPYLKRLPIGQSLTWPWTDVVTSLTLVVVTLKVDRTG